MAIIYIIFSAIIPVSDSKTYDTSGNVKTNSSLVGVSLILVGILLLFNNLSLLYFPEFFSIIKNYSRKLIDFWPILLVVLGIYLLVDTSSKNRHG